MELEDVLTRMENTFGDYGVPTNEGDLLRLQEATAPLPESILELYRKRNASTKLARISGSQLTARLMPTGEAIQFNKRTAEFSQHLPKVANVVWLWTDDNSNYVGAYTDGRLSGWLTLLDHEKPVLVPAFRSVAGFLTRLLKFAPGRSAEYEAACDLPTVPREVPAIEDDPRYMASDRSLATAFREEYLNGNDVEKRRLSAMCAICLTPVADTSLVLEFLRDRDMWIPETAVSLLELRNFREGIPYLEALARDGTANGDSAAMRLLVRIGTRPSQMAISRLKNCLDDRKLASLEMWTEFRSRLQPPRWP